MNRHVGIVADLVDGGDRFGGAQTDAFLFVCEKRLRLVGNSADVAGNRVIVGYMLERLDAYVCFVLGRWKFMITVYTRVPAVNM